MSFFTRQERYEMLRGIKQGTRTGSPLTADEEQFIQDVAMEKLQDLLSEPEIQAAMTRLATKD